MKITAAYIAEQLCGEVVGDPNVEVSSVARIEQGKPGTVCFFANPKYEKYLYTTKASVVLINRDFNPKEPISATLIYVDNAYESVATLLGVLNAINSAKRRGISGKADIRWSAKIGKGVYVGSYSVIGKRCVIGASSQIDSQVYIGDDVTIGENCVIYPGVKIYPRCSIGSNVIIHANAVIGSDGFGFARTEEGSYKKIPQTGNVVIEDDCEIGANTVIDRATMGSTIIRRGVKLDNLVQIAHNVEVGEDTVIAAQAGVSGSTVIGNQCQIGGQAGIVGHSKLADKTQVVPQSGVTNGTKIEGSVLMGSPAFEHREFLRAYAVFKKLHKLDIK